MINNGSVARCQNLILFVPWIVPGLRAWVAIQEKEGIKFCSAAWRIHSHSSPKGQKHTLLKSGYSHLATMINGLKRIEAQTEKSVNVTIWHFPECVTVSDKCCRICRLPFTPKVARISFTFINFEDKFKFVTRCLLVDPIMRQETNCRKE